MNIFRYLYSFPFLDSNGKVFVDDNCVGPLYEHVFAAAFGASLSFVGLPWKVDILVLDRSFFLSLDWVTLKIFQLSPDLYLFVHWLPISLRVVQTMMLPSIYFIHIAVIRSWWHYQLLPSIYIIHIAVIFRQELVLDNFPLVVLYIKSIISLDLWCVLGVSVWICTKNNLFRFSEG